MHSIWQSKFASTLEFTKKFEKILSFISKVFQLLKEFRNIILINGLIKIKIVEKCNN